MQVKKAVISAVILYALIFLIASVLMFVAKITDDAVFGSLMVIIVAILTFLVAKGYYFKGVEVAKPLNEGLALGIALVVIIILIEIPVMVYGFAAQQEWDYFLSWHIILGYILAVVVSVMAAKLAKKKQ